MSGERIFQILAVALIGVAAWFLWNGDTDMLFAAVVLASCSFFISIRFQIKDRMRSREAAETELLDEGQTDYIDDPEPEPVSAVESRDR